MTRGEVRLSISAGVASIVFDRPEAYNAMTWNMYEMLARHCTALKSDSSIKVITLRGAGGKAFISGTDIEQFRDFDGAEAGVAYERRIEDCINLIETLAAPTIAVLDGWVMGGGLVIAAACDFRLATPSAKFGAPIARTLGNCLSLRNTARLVAQFGAHTVKRMLMMAQVIDTDEALLRGFLTEIVEPEHVDSRIASMCETLSSHAPLTMAVAKETVRRVVVEADGHDEDLVRVCYGSNDFKEGVAAFTEKRKALWKGN